jgi:hypothetical protein
VSQTARDCELLSPRLRSPVVKALTYTDKMRVYREQSANPEALLPVCPSLSGKSEASPKLRNRSQHWQVRCAADEDVEIGRNRDTTHVARPSN